jgi:hypothetical protein
MKLSRSEFKQIIKECLVEILAEGMGSSERLKEEINKHSQPRLGNKSPRDHVKYSSHVQHDLLSKSRLNDVIKAESKGDPVLAAILADTASTTLPNMLMNESNKNVVAPVGTIENIVASNAPEDIFGDEAASKWAALAFADTPKKF